MKETADQLLFNTEQRMYKYWDHRCLVPYSHKDPTKWKTYEMHDYRRAFDMATLKSVDQYKYDNNFFNWVDPEVLKFFATEPKRAWRKTYGYPYSTARSWDGQNMKPANMTKCFIKCAQYVRNPRHRTKQILCLCVCVSVSLSVSVSASVCQCLCV